MIIIEKYNAVVEIYEKWPTLSNSQKTIVKEYIKSIHPSKKKEIDIFFSKIEGNLLKEEWSLGQITNTVLDVIGWVDPTGIADALSGVIYLARGEYLFGFLSFVAAVPYAGDVVAKPIMAALKLGKPSTKVIQNAMKLTKAGKSAEAAKLLTDASKSSKLIDWFLKKMAPIGSKLKQFVQAMPGGPLKGFKNTILEWIELFSKTAKSGRTARLATAQFAKNFPKLSKADQLKNLKTLEDGLKSIKGPFTGYRTPGKLFSWKTFWGGMPQAFGRNKSVRALMRKTKWYLGLLDFMGIGNFVGPEEISDKMSEEELTKKVEEYNQTPQAEQYMKDEFGDESLSSDDIDNIPQSKTSQSSEPSQPETAKSSEDPISSIFKNMLTGNIARGALAMI